eukprot:CAMPEP_0169142076 /NCGR_PEP_ID=MMETSP1015-20121227/44731_1 /TAXON_ID=342587 /ORGANISM="Karlodinium micrum, Strain CCMP2283" /LENGTH=143 /DNA_ID=CAMNT_0009208667 /DNA_START=60 /DNA_END=489 /DNA_ORIENTATION=-
MILIHISKRKKAVKKCSITFQIILYGSSLSCNSNPICKAFTQIPAMMIPVKIGPSTKFFGSSPRSFFDLLRLIQNADDASTSSRFGWESGDEKLERSRREQLDRCLDATAEDAANAMAAPEYSPDAPRSSPAPSLNGGWLLGL